MSDLQFEAKASWSGQGVQGEGLLAMGEHAINYSSPAQMGGKGVGVSPEDLLIGAVSTCYSGTLFSVISRSKLPVQQVRIRAEGIVTGYPVQSKFSRLVVHPTIIGGDVGLQAEYEKAAVAARDKCFIGKTIRGNVDYEVGEVKVVNVQLEEQVLDKLIEHFYQNLVNVDYYRDMFAQRNVDLELLKQRQKTFIARLVNSAASEEEHQGMVEQVRERHPFRTTPERAAIWLDVMSKTMDEIQLEQETKALLMEKITDLMEQFIDKGTE